MECKQCGACCRYMAFKTGRLSAAEINFFAARGTYVTRGMVVIRSRCPNLLPDNRCAIQAFKPEICAKAPCMREEKWFKDALHYFGDD